MKTNSTEKTLVLRYVLTKNYIKKTVENGFKVLKYLSISKNLERISKYLGTYIIPLTSLF